MVALLLVCGPWMGSSALAQGGAGAGGGASPAPARAEPLSAEVRVSEGTVYEGQRVRVQIVVEGSDAPEQPDLSHVKDFDAQFISGGTSNRTSVVIINGRMQQEDSRGFVYTFDLVPKRTGVLTIPSITIRDGARSATTQALAIRVNPPGENADVRVEFALDPPSPYVGEPTAVRVKLSIRSNADVEEFVFKGLDELFTVPAADPSRRNLRQQSVVLLGEQVPWVQGQETIDGLVFYTFTAERSVVPARAGTGEVSLAMTGSVVTRPGDGFFTRDQRQAISIKGNTVKVTVRELPTKGRPADFNNLVGRFTVSVSAEPISVNVGDPIALKITVNGSGPMDRVPRPDLRRVLGERFRVPDDMATPELRPGQVVFTQTVRPTSAEVTEIPAVEFPYFDTQSGMYSTARSNPIPLRVAGTRVITSGDAVSALPAAVSAPELKERTGGIKANIDSAAILADQRFDVAKAARSPMVIAVAAGPGVVYAGALAVVALRRRGAGAAGSARRKGALAAAQSRLEGAGGAGAHAEIARAMAGYVADRFDLHAAGGAAGLTARECEERLRPLSAEGASAFRAVLERCDAARFAGLDSGGIDELRRAALAALAQVEGCAKRGGGR